MTKLIYPIVFVFNKDTSQYNGYIPDLSIVSEGVTLQEALSEAKELAKNYFILAKKYAIKPEKPSSKEVTASKWPGYEISTIEIEWQGEGAPEPKEFG